MDYTHFKAQLEERKREIEQKMIKNNHYGLDRGFASDRASGELSQYDNHPADSGTELYEREKDMAMLDHVEEELEEIKHALKRMEQGTYGVCAVTGKQIPKERLEALPTARTLKEYASAQHVPNDRSIEEEVLEEIDQGDDREPDAYQQAASFNENSMTYEDSSLQEEDEGAGYTEEFEPFVSTDIHGYTGDENIHLEHNLHYEKYKEEHDEWDK
ncbi:TraR/DksA C4-type zinc finger protein [Halobacillus sp. A5]|uniref:TraR/DksA C4-type zinc finger protein n=1 Tax=Halobacillus sp. A5 TaxID=2880263 RepID=UPI0020A6A530|nr:TraR/DksA C4-type zinc finger protein [Halobacillus sp. A5]MCP3028866.1 TraR/DksA C4-type zinc finger protein [Halobacillus sp. A5]